MATTDPTAAAPSPAPGPEGPRGSQSRVSPILLWILAAAVLFRVVTYVTDRGKTDATLVRWMAAPAAQSLSRTGKQPILYDFTAAWCPPCKILDREGWNDPEVAAFVNATYLPSRIVDRQREEGKNSPEVSALQRRHGVQVFPTLVVVGPDGGEVAKFAGYRGRAALVKFLQESAAASARR
ncbi:MAG: thioredoxin family protein [Thermoanaerobaculia bacterium]